MPNIRTSVVINQPLERVFEFVIRACRQSQWHWTASCTTSDTPPPALGDSFTEDFLVAGKRGRITWTVRELRPPHRWVLSGVCPDGGTATLIYGFLAAPGGARVKRELSYNVPALMDGIGDFLTLRNRIQAESADALRRLKHVVEGS
jgi:uncharacterized protein YndB with AHSA1/START domain